MKKTLLVAMIAVMTTRASSAYADDIPADFFEALGDELLMCSVISLTMRREDTAYIETWTNRHYALKQMAAFTYLDADPQMTERKFDMMFALAANRYVKLLATDKGALHDKCQELYEKADEVCRDAESKCPYPAQR